MTAMLDSIGYAGWALHALIWLPILAMGLVLWSEEERAKHVAFWSSLAVPLGRIPGTTRRAVVGVRRR